MRTETKTYRFIKYAVIITIAFLGATVLYDSL